MYYTAMHQKKTFLNIKCFNSTVLNTDYKNVFIITMQDASRIMKPNPRIRTTTKTACDDTPRQN